MSRTQGFRWVVVAVVSAVGAMAPAARAVKPGEWVHQTEADFQSAELDHTVITNLGRVELSRASDQLANLPEDDAIVYDIAVAGGRTYLAVGPKGRLAELTAEHKIAELAAFENEQVFALAADGEAVWVGVSGADGRIEKRVGETVQETIKLPGVRYVWDVLVVGGKLWVATGTEGQVLVVDPQAPDGEPIVALDTDQKNVLCLAADDKQQVYAGTDGEGLIYRIAANPRAGQEEEKPFSVFVLYDAAEPEIGALVVTADGTVYAGTADADQARPGRLAEAVQEEKGETEKPQPEAGRIKDGDEGGDGGNGDEVPPAPEPQPEPEPKPETAPAPDTPPAEDGAPDKPPADDNRVEGVGESGPPGPSAAPGTEVVIGRPTAFALQEADAAPAPSDTPGPAADARPDAPTKQQYTALRKVVSERLARLRKGQQAGPGAGAAPGGSRLSPRRPSGGNGGGSPPKEGNAVYRIGADGFVSEVFRESVMILRIVEHDGRLVIATGNEGQVYRVDPANRETTVIADLNCQQVPAMAVIDERIIIGTANPAEVAALGAGYADAGTFTSDPLDAQQPSLWGRLSVLAALPEGTRVTVATRSANIGNADAEGWSDWSHARLIEPEAPGQPVYVKVDSPTARFIQYRLTLESNGDATPSVSKIALKYLVPNMQPRIASLKATYPDADPKAPPTPLTKVNVEWEAADPNGDALRYTIELQSLGGDAPFIRLADELTGGNYEWDTASTPDGRYKLRLTASDAIDNVPGEARTDKRLSRVVVVDNTAPTVEDFSVKPGPTAGTLTVIARATDAISTISDIRYAVNGSDAWQAVLPADRIYDSTSENVSFTISDLSPGPTVVGLRATDALGNSRYVAATADVAGEK